MLTKKLLGRYLLEQHLGGGGQGDVYLAFDEEIGRRVAVKIMHPAQGETPESLADTQDRVRQEAQATARFEHVNVVRVFDFQIMDDGTPFLVMEYLNGIPLDKLPLPLEPTLLRLFVSNTCAALQKAHEQGLIHRDLKPSNVMLVDQGKDEQRFVVLDFGVAKMTHQGQAVGKFTYAGAGTALYMSPEQAYGESGDYRSDIYAFGSMLFELLTGKCPFDEDGQNLATLMKAVCERQPPTLQVTFPGRKFSRELETLVWECLSKHPDDRPQSMREIGQRFAAALPAPRKPAGFSPPVKLMLVLLALGASSWGAFALLGMPGILPGSPRQSAVPPEPPQGQQQTASTDANSETTDPNTSSKTAAEQKLTKVQPDPQRDVPKPMPELKIRNIEPFVVNELELLKINLQEFLSNPQATKIQFVLGPTPDGVSGAKLSTAGELTWRPEEQAGPGKFQIPVRIVDVGTNHSIETTIQIDVKEVNTPPSLGEIPDQQAVAGQELKLPIRVSDADLPANPVTLRLGEGNASGAKIVAESSSFVWTPSFAETGKTYSVTIEALDDEQSKSAEVSRKFQITVVPLMVVNSIGMKLVAVDAGQMPVINAGNSPADAPVEKDSAEKDSSEKGQAPGKEHLFLLGAYEVTQSQFLRVTSRNPSVFTTQVTMGKVTAFPVENVTIEDALEFCQKLSALPEEQAAGRRYRLPTEQEWEIACRAGTTSKFSCGDTLKAEFARFNQGEEGHPTAVGLTRKPNLWGFYDMHGNVWEMCISSQADKDLDPEKFWPGYAIRGGGWFDQADVCSATYRSPAFREPIEEIGFRVVCEQFRSPTP